MRKLIIFVALMLAAPAFAQYDPTQPSQDWSLNSDYSCVYQDAKPLAIGTLFCDPNFNITNVAAWPMGWNQAIVSLSGLGVGQVSAPNLVLIDSTGSTGGVSSGINVQLVGSGGADVAAVLAGTGTFPVVTLTGALPAGPEQGWIEETGPAYTDTTTAFGSDATDVTIFAANNDYIYVGNATTYFEIQVLLDTVSSVNVTPIFEFSTGAGWTAFSPNDGTAGFTRNGNISFDKDELISAGWAARSVNGVSKYYIRIQRTRTVIGTAPIEDTILLADGAINQWDPDGNLTIQQILTQGSAHNDLSGRVHLTGVHTTHDTCDATNVGLIEMYDDGANKTSLCVCERTGAATYAWGNVTSGGSC